MVVRKTLFFVKLRYCLCLTKRGNVLFHSNKSLLNFGRKDMNKYEALKVCFEQLTNFRYGASVQIPASNGFTC